MHFVVGHVSGAEADHLLTLVAGMGEVLLVARNATSMIVSQHVLLSSQDGVAAPAAEMLTMPILVQRLGVLACEDELVAGAAPRLEVFGVVPLAEYFLLEDAVGQVDL